MRPRRPRSKAVKAKRAGDILQVLLADVVELGGDVDAVAVNVAVLDDDVAEVDADPEAVPLPLRYPGDRFIPLFDRFIPVFDRFISLLDRLGNFARNFFSQQRLRSSDGASQGLETGFFACIFPASKEMAGSGDRREDQCVEGRHTGAARADQQRVDLDAGKPALPGDGDLRQA